MRTFIALELPASFVHETAGLARQLQSVIKARFVPRENYHLTLAFLGELNETHVRLAMDALDCSFKDSSAPTISCNGLGIFGRRRDATLWLGLKETEALMTLAATVRAELSARTVSFDTKKFKPHITLARRARIPQESLVHLPFPATCTPRALTLFKSTLSSDGASYKPLYVREFNK